MLWHVGENEEDIITNGINIFTTIQMSLHVSSPTVLVEEMTRPTIGGPMN